MSVAQKPPLNSQEWLSKSSQLKRKEDHEEESNTKKRKMDQKEEHEEEEKEEKENFPPLDSEKFKSLMKIINLQSQVIKTGMCLPSNKSTLQVKFGTAELINLQDFDLQTVFSNWYNNFAKASAFGNTTTQTTEYNEEVRKAKEIPASEWELSKDLLDRLKKWLVDKHLFSFDIELKPIKMNFYQTGDHFISHRDTPSNTLVGTLLLGLGDTCTVDTFTVEYLDGTLESWSSEFGEVIFFYSDRPHCVKKLTDGIRGTISFEVHSVTKNLPQPTHITAQQKVTELLNKVSSTQPFGIFLNHLYSLDAKELKGGDAILYNSLSNMKNRKVFLVPVITSIKLQKDCESNEIRQQTKVFLFTEDHIQFLLGNSSNHPKTKQLFGQDVSNLSFFGYNFTDDGFVWNHTVQKYIEYNGNESVPAAESSVYIHKAFIVI